MYAQAIQISHPGRQLQQTVVMVLFSMDGLLVQVKMSCLCSFKGGQGACVWPMCCSRVEVSFAWSLRCMLLTLQMSLQTLRGRWFPCVFCVHSWAEPSLSQVCGFLSLFASWQMNTALESGQSFYQPSNYIFISFLNMNKVFTKDFFFFLNHAWFQFYS